jgi:hypothetical protein
VDCKLRIHVPTSNMLTILRTRFVTICHCKLEFNNNHEVMMSLVKEDTGSFIQIIVISWSRRPLMGKEDLQKSLQQIHHLTAPLIERPSGHQYRQNLAHTLLMVLRSLPTKKRSLLWLTTLRVIMAARYHDVHDLLEVPTACQTIFKALHQSCVLTLPRMVIL